MKLLQKQFRFTQLVAQLILEVHIRGYDLTFSEAWRSPEEAQRLANLGKGIKNSLHTQRLAIDFNLFKNGKWLENTEDWKRIGEWWEQQSTPDYKCVWGGRFGDGNHFSIEHGGRK